MLSVAAGVQGANGRNAAQRSSRTAHKGMRHSRQGKYHAVYTATTLLDAVHAAMTLLCTVYASMMFLGVVHDHCSV